ncbi:MAG: 50S ribosomal protein L19 [Candidatus Peribacteraceae bacterium]
MTGAFLTERASTMLQARPDIRPGFTVRVHQKVQEGDKERVQMFEGLVIAVHRGHSAADHTITVRKIASGVGVERVFPVHSPLIEKIEVKKVAKVRRAKLNFLRTRTGKKARLSERFTGSEEFGAIAVPVAELAATEEVVAEAPVAEAEKTA